VKKSTHADLVNACLAYLQLKGIVAWANATTGIRRTDKRTGRSFWTKSKSKGAADIFGIIPPTGQFLAVECKVGRDDLSDDQRAFIENVFKAGGVTVVVRDMITDLESAFP
jgi:hypothetical protein